MKISFNNFLIFCMLFCSQAIVASNNRAQQSAHQGQRSSLHNRYTAAEQASLQSLTHAEQIKLSALDNMPNQKRLLSFSIQDIKFLLRAINTNIPEQATILNNKLRASNYKQLIRNFIDKPQGNQGSTDSDEEEDDDDEADDRRRRIPNQNYRTATSQQAARYTVNENLKINALGSLKNKLYQLNPDVQHELLSFDVATIQKILPFTQNNIAKILSFGETDVPKILNLDTNTLQQKLSAQNYKELITDAITVKVPEVAVPIEQQVEKIINIMYFTDETMLSTITKVNLPEKTGAAKASGQIYIPTITEIIQYSYEVKPASIDKINALKVALQAIQMAITQQKYSLSASSWFAGWFGKNKEINKELDRNLHLVQDRLHALAPDYSNYYKTGAGVIGAAAIAYMAMQNKDTLAALPGAIGNYVPTMLFPYTPSLNFSWVPRIAPTIDHAATGTAATTIVAATSIAASATGGAIAEAAANGAQVLTETAST